ncbi:IS110 family transposase [Dyadobacter diqingensis]|uniref:IS110 family transposase n=1 Tax=Dyadobacter diqingensis TaxID=2938121 RepID=UPI0020C1B3F4|nr:IS110 family transposase [Dyadobacter diqingensis]
MKERTVVCGLDVHKDTIYTALYNGKDHTEVQKFSTFGCGIKKLSTWLQDHDVKKVAMESTGTYWIPTWNELEGAGLQLVLVNPWFIKQMPGRKRDVADAQWIATLLHKDLLRRSLVPPRSIRELRNYSRKFVQLQYQITRVLQQMNKCLELCNIRINNVMTKMDSVSSIGIIRAIVAGNSDHQTLMDQVNAAVKKRKKGMVEQALEGAISDDQKFLLELGLQQYDLLLDQASRIETRMEEHCQQHYASELKLLRTIPGIGKQSGMQIIAETGADMNAFRSSSAISSWAGLRPRNDESAGKIKNNHITKGNNYLRRILVQTSWSATRCKESYFKYKFEQLHKRMNSKKALIAIARKMLTVVWNVLYKQEPYNAHYQPVYNEQRVAAQIRYHQQIIDKLNSLG